MQLKTDFSFFSQASVFTPIKRLLPYASADLARHVSTNCMNIENQQKALKACNHLIESLNQDLLTLNQTLMSYNQGDGLLIQRQKLQSIHKQRQYILNHYGDASDTIGEEQFDNLLSQLQDSLWDTICQESKSLGIQSLKHLDWVDFSEASSYTQFPETLEDIIENLSRSDLDDLLEVLNNDFTMDEIVELFDEDEGEDEGDTNQSAQVSLYKTVMNRIENIESVSGNTPIWKVSFKDGSPTKLLKLVTINPNLGEPEERIRQNPEIGKFLNHISAERHLTHRNEDSLQYRHLILTEYCNQGDLLDVSKNLFETPNSHHEKILKIKNLFVQIIDFFKGLESIDCGYMDAHLGNFLVHDDKIRICDYKSLLLAHKGQFKYSESQLHTGYMTIVAEDYRAPECSYNFPKEEWAMVELAPIHAYLLGVSLYDFITQFNPGTIRNSHYKGANLSFEKPIFQTKEGEILKQIICGLINPNPKERMTLERALLELMSIPGGNLNDLKSSCYSILTELTRYKPKGDLIERYKTALFLAPNEANLQDILVSIESQLKKEKMFHAKIQQCASLFENLELDSKSRDLFNLKRQKLLASATPSNIDSICDTLFLIMKEIIALNDYKKQGTNLLAQLIRISVGTLPVPVPLKAIQKELYILTLRRAPMFIKKLETMINQQEQLILNKKEQCRKLLNQIRSFTDASSPILNQAEAFLSANLQEVCVAQLDDVINSLNSQLNFRNQMMSLGKRNSGIDNKARLFNYVSFVDSPEAHSKKIKIESIENTSAYREKHFSAN